MGFLTSKAENIDQIFSHRMGEEFFHSSAPFVVPSRKKKIAEESVLSIVLQLF